MPPARRYAFVVSQELEAPAVSGEQLGQIVTLGRRYTSARESFGTVLLPAPGRASVHFTIFADGPRHHSERSLWYYIDEYIREDPRVSHLFVGARVTGGAGQRMMLRDAPARVVRNGLIGLGDAVTPGGHLGIVPAIFMGRQAALAAAEALDSSDPADAPLDGYQQLMHGGVLGNLEAERRLVLGLNQIIDGDIDRLCGRLHTLQQGTPFFGSWRPTAWETVAWFVRQFPLLANRC
jgi:flavin-dependent dehydrogenase